MSNKIKYSNTPFKGCDDNHTAMKIHPAIRKDQAMTVDPITRKRRSPVDQRFEPYLRKHEIDENENRTSKTDESVPDINSSLVNVIEEVRLLYLLLISRTIRRLSILFGTCSQSCLCGFTQKFPICFSNLFFFVRIPLLKA